MYRQNHLLMPFGPVKSGGFGLPQKRALAQIRLARNRRLYVIVNMKSECIIEVWNLGPVTGSPLLAESEASMVGRNGIGVGHSPMKKGNCYATL